MNTLEQADEELTRASEREGPRALRWALAFVFLWFGAMKLRPGGSSIEEMAGDTVHKLTGGRIGRKRGILMVGLLECAVGLGLLTGRARRLTLGVMTMHLVGVSSPLILFPKRCFRGPLALTAEGQFIVKNTVLAAAGFELLGRAKKPRRTQR